MTGAPPEKTDDARIETPQLGDHAFRQLVEGVTDYAICMLDPNGYVTSWNAGAERLKQYRSSEIIGRHFSVFYSIEDNQNGKPAMELEVAAREGRFEDEGWRQRRDGTRFWANVVLAAIYNADRSLTAFAQITRDLSDRRASEEKLRQSETRLRLLIESIHDYAVFMLEPDGRVATWNPGAQRIKGYRPEEIIGRPFTVFYSDADVRSGKCERELAVATATGRFEEEGWRYRKGGARFWASVVINAVRDERGTLVGFSKVTRDLTERKKAQEEQAAREVAEQANRAKDEFLAMLGHELRNPLAPIVTALQLMKLRGDGHVTKEQEIIDRQVKHMVRLVDDLLDMSRISRGTIELKMARIDLRDSIANAIEAVSPFLEQRQHQLHVDVPDERVMVHADPTRMTQVLTNLLTNAVKYTDPGGHISVSIERADGEIRVDVKDDGIGIAPELLPKVFEIFVQGHQGAERSAGGLGLGLSLVHMLVEKHGGRVRARSAGIGRGSTFSIYLPSVNAHEAAATDPSPVAAPKSGAVRKVLVVDDNQDGLELLAEALKMLGYEVQAAEDSLAALEAAAWFKPDVAIIDIGLPVMDGYELAARLQGDLGDQAPRMIALTGYGQPSDRERSFRAGFELHLVKPVDIDELLRRMTHLLGTPAN